MPTGFTAIIEERDNVSFEEFVWRCAKGVCAFIHMRDDGLDAEIKMPPQDNYYSKRLDEACSNLNKYSKMSLETAQILMNKEYKSAIDSAKETLKEHRELKKKYDRMLCMVKAWTPPTEDHKDFKKFMVEQLESSIRFDCSEDYYLEIINRPRQTAKEWLTDKITEAKHDIEYNAKHNASEQINYQKKVDWIKSLIKSVPLPNANK